MQKKVICLRDDDDLGYFTLTSHCTEGFPGGASGKEPTCQCRRRIRDTGSIPGSGKSPGGGHGKPVQYFCLKNSMDRGVGRATVHGVTKSRTRLKQLSTAALY